MIAAAPPQWLSANGTPRPDRVVDVTDTLTADEAYRMASEGVAMLWHGDFQNARQLLNAMSRRATKINFGDGTPAERFYRYRQARSHRARILGRLLIPLESDTVVPLRRAPDLRAAWAAAFDPVQGPTMTPLPELLGVIGAYEWRKRGIYVDALQGRIHPHYGTFAPTRGEYVDLVASADLPSKELAFDIGTGTGVLAAVLARRGVRHVIATDDQPRAFACAQENLQRLELTEHIDLLLTDLFPPGRAPLIVCNPPWIPGTPHSLLDHAIYDPRSRMLRRFLSGLHDHLEPGGEGWLILSDLAEHLGLRSRTDLLEAIEAAGLRVTGRIDARPSHPRAADTADPLHAARAQEVTSLWLLTASSAAATSPQPPSAGDPE